MKSSDLFKKNKPVIREFKTVSEGDPGDLPYLWDIYRKGKLVDLPENLTMEQFLETSETILELVSEAWVIEDFVDDVLKPVVFVFCKSDGWILEPYAIYLDNATPRSVLRTYVGFIKKTKYRKDIGACLVRVDKDSTKITNKIEEMGLLEYVGKVWGGAPHGNQYLYSVRCGRRA